MRVTSIGGSITLHTAIVAALLYLQNVSPSPRGREPSPRRYVVPLVVPARLVGDHGGGQRDPLPASLGRLPPRATHRIFVPPAATRPNDNAHLLVAQAILMEPDLPVPEVDIEQIGSPFGVKGLISGGPGGPKGLGGGCCSGVGDGEGPGIGGSAAAPAHERPRHPRRPPHLIYKTEPEYSDEARKAKVQGLVVLAARVGTNGRLEDIRVLQSLGLGLDERAMEAAALWRFQPALADGQPVPVTIKIEVNFRLL